MKQIMLATDFSERSDRALRRAGLIAREKGARLHIVHAVDDDRPQRLVNHEMDDARVLLSEMAGSIREVEGVECSTAIVAGDPFEGILAEAERSASDLLVIGPHRRQVLRDAFLGTTAERTIRSARCPVLMVNGPPVAAWRHILFATDLSDISRAALQVLQAGGIAGGCRLSILHLFDAPALQIAGPTALGTDGRQDYLASRRTEARRQLADFMASSGEFTAEQMAEPEETNLANDILRHAEMLAADLVVVSTSGKGDVTRFFLGSVAEQVLRAATVDVLAIPPGATVRRPG